MRVKFLLMAISFGVDNKGGYRRIQEYVGILTGVHKFTMVKHHKPAKDPQRTAKCVQKTARKQENLRRTLRNLPGSCTVRRRP